MHLERKLGEQSFPYDTKEIFEPIIEKVIKTSEKVLEESKAKTAPIEKVVTIFPGTSNALANTQKFNNSLKTKKNKTLKNRTKKYIL